MSVVLSVLICTYNREELLPICLSSLVEQTLDRSKYEVIVVDNNSTDNTRRIAESFAAKYDNFRVVLENKQGLSHARNCWREAKGEFVAYLDDDAKASPEWCERVVQAFKTVSPQPAAVGGEIRPFYETSPPAWFTEDFELRTWGAAAAFLAPPRARYGFSGSNMAFPKAVLEQFGGFSADFGQVGYRTRLGEDTEFFFRVYETHPWFWYDPAIVVFHWTPRRNMKLSYRVLRNFRNGESIASIEKRRILSVPYLACLLATGYLIAATPFFLIARRNFLQRAVKRSEELAGKLGYLLARVP